MAKFNLDVKLVWVELSGNQPSKTCRSLFGPVMETSVQSYWCCLYLYSMSQTLKSPIIV